MQQRAIDVHGQEEVRLGTAHYLEWQGRQDMILVLYDNGTESTVTATQLRSIMLDRQSKPPRAKPAAKVSWALGTGVRKEVHPGTVPVALASAMPGTHAEAREHVTAPGGVCW